MRILIHHTFVQLCLIGYDAQCSFIRSGYFNSALQVRCYSEALPTQHGYCVGVSRRQATASEEIAQGPYVAASARFEHTTLRTIGDESTNECCCFSRYAFHWQTMGFLSF